MRSSDAAQGAPRSEGRATTGSPSWCRKDLSHQERDENLGLLGDAGLGRSRLPGGPIHRASALLLWWRAGDWNSILATPFDGVLVTLFILLSNPVTIAVLVLAVWLARADQTDYLALTWPPARDVTSAIVWPRRADRGLRCAALFERPRRW